MRNICTLFYVQVCKSVDDEVSMLLCDGCDKGYHTYCMDPPIETVPEGDWFCPECVKKDKDTDKGESGARTPGSGDAKMGLLRARRRKSRWSSGMVPKKKSAVKKKILESDHEDDEDDESVNAEKEKNESMDVEKSEVSNQDISNIDPDLTPSSPRPAPARVQPTASGEHCTPLACNSLIISFISNRDPAPASSTTEIRRA